MFDEMNRISSGGSADNTVVKFTTVARNVRLFIAHTHVRRRLQLTLVNSIVDDALVHAVSNVQQTLLQFVSAVQLRLMHSLLHVALYLAIDRTEVDAIWRPQIWRNENGF